MRDLEVHVRPRPGQVARRWQPMDLRFWRGVLRAALVIFAFAALGMLYRAGVVWARSCNDGDPVYAKEWR